MKSTYQKYPSQRLSGDAAILTGTDMWNVIAEVAKSKSGGTVPLIVVDAYPGIDVEGIVLAAQVSLPEFEVIDFEQEVALPSSTLDSKLAASLTDDRVFGHMNHFSIEEFLDDERLSEFQKKVARRATPTVLVGWGATIAADETTVVVLADIARWELQRRQRAGATNWRASNDREDPLRKYKRGYFVEWRTADRHKRTLFDRLDFFLDANKSAEVMTAVSGDVFRRALRETVVQPFRLVPFFDPGVWGGQWMKEKFDLEKDVDNYAWCFDCVPEENSLLFEKDGHTLEMPAINLVLGEPEGLLGRRTYARFGAEFPIRFDLLDTMGGQNLSLQVHPLTDYIHKSFGMTYTQDESYYILDCGPGASIYLGLKSGVDKKDLLDSLNDANRGAKTFDAEHFVNVLPVAKHDHFSIPAGTVHCSGANSMVLEISATPFIFTFKLWDWDRTGVDGLPRPIHIEHGAKNIDWRRDTEWVNTNLLNQTEVVENADGVFEERTGLHDLEFLEVRRHWFAESALHDTQGTVNVLNLVDGDVVRVVSPTGEFAPFEVHYAETFIVPAAVGKYRIERSEWSKSASFATVKAYVRGT